MSSRGPPRMVNAKMSMFNMDDKAVNSLFYCSLLALQFGLQPMLASKFTPSGVAKSSVVITTEICKIVIAILSYLTGPAAEFDKIRETWTIRDSLAVAALPATLYAIQNLCVQYGYVLVDSMTFNLLNQTKTLAAALWLFLIMGQRQSTMQMVALLILLGAAFLLNFGPGTGKNNVGDMASFNLGLMCVAAASMISGLSTALTQKALTTSSKPRPAVFLSAELAVYGIIVLLGQMIYSGELRIDRNFFVNWELQTLIPVISNAFGGIVVGQVTKYAGGVVKGFALIAGLIVTGFANWLIDGKPLGTKDLVAVVLVSLSIFLHSSYPPKKVDTVKKQL